ncbi:T9SS type A sorting domain-containing protein [candidate division KSB1 bacterium]|nr:T9SS type A sorting domain-containing protein [candidate division KSB1 bacterium]
MKQIMIMVGTITYLSLTPTLFPQTNVNGSVSGTWKRNKSPYIVVGDINIPKGSRLLIESGIQVRFAGQYEFAVQGLLQATGAERDTIVFTHHFDHKDSTWNGIRFYKANPSCKLKYCKIEFGKSSANNYGSKYDLGGGIYLDSTNIIINNSLIVNNIAEYGGGLFCQNFSDVKIFNSTVKNNRASNGGGIHCSNSKLMIGNSELSLNSTWNRGAAIYCSVSQVYMLNVAVFNNEARADHGAIMAESGSVINISNCVFYKNVDSWGEYDKSIDLWNNCYLGITNSILSKSNVGNTASPVIIQFSSVEGGFEGKGNLNGNPLFRDADKGDFRLKQNSPCKDSGYPSSICNDWDGSRNDMGIFGGSGILAVPNVINFGFLGIGQNKQAEFVIANFRETNFTISSANLLKTTHYSSNFSAPALIKSMDVLSTTFTCEPKSSGLLYSQFVLNSPDLIGQNSAFIDLEVHAGVWSGIVSGIWRKSFSPYILGGDILIPAGNNLIIEPGVNVLVDTTLGGRSVKVVVEGSLEAVGTENDSIIFSLVQDQRAPGHWDGIKLILEQQNFFSQDGGDSHITGEQNDGRSETAGKPQPVKVRFALESIPENDMLMKRTGNARLSYCRVEYANTGITTRGENALVDHCLVQKNKNHGVLWNGIETWAAGQLLNSNIRKNGGWGVWCDAYCSERSGDASPLISGNKIEQNGLGGIKITAGGYVGWGWIPITKSANASPSIEYNRILNNEGPGIRCFSNGEIVYDGSTFRRFAYTRPKILRNEIVHNQCGLEAATGCSDEQQRMSFSEPNIENVVFYKNNGQEIISSDSAAVDIKNSIIWGISGTAIQTAAGGQVSTSFCNINHSYSGVGNIKSEPHFVSPGDLDFHLLFNSPCIDIGDPESPNDPDKTRADIGVYYYHQSISQFSLLSPENKTVVNVFKPEFKWIAPTTTGGEPLTFDLYLSPENTFSGALTTIQKDLTANSYTLSQKLADNSVYFWKILARNPWSKQKWSNEVWEFKVNTVNDPPVFSGLPDVHFLEDKSTTLSLNEYVYDPDHTHDELIFKSFIIDFKEPHQLFLNSPKMRQPDLPHRLDISDLNINIDAATHVVTFSSTSDSNGVFTVVFEVQDPPGKADYDTIIVSIMPVNDVPQIMPLPLIAFNEDDSLIFPVENWYQSINDDEDKDSTLRFELQTGKFTYGYFKNNCAIFKALADSFGIDTLKLKVIDSNNYFSTADLPAHIISVNDPPFLSVPDSIRFNGNISNVLQIWDWVYDKENSDDQLIYKFQTGCEYQFDSSKGLLLLKLQDIIDRFYLFISVADDSNATAMDSVMLILTCLHPDLDEFPDQYEFFQNYPNPFNSQTILHYNLPKDEKVIISIFNLKGEKIKELWNGLKKPGKHQLVWNAGTIPSGTYFVQFTAGNFKKVVKCIYLK